MSQYLKVQWSKQNIIPKMVHTKAKSLEDKEAADHTPPDQWKGTENIRKKCHENK